MTSIILDREAATDSTARLPIADDRAMLKAAAELTRDINAPRAGIYWGDFLGSVAIGYAGLVLAVLSGSTWIAIAAALIAVLALYRALSFIHELTHVRHAVLPGFRFAYNLFIGVPMLVPSFMYEGVHNLHHARTRYGTSEDPEYLPLALMKPWTLPAFIVVAGLTPIALMFRFAVLSPLSLLIAPLRRMVVERYSALAINPAFRRRMPEGDFRAQWNRIEVACACWAIALLALVATGTLPLRAFVIMLAISSGVAVLNQVRTLVAHLWENEGEAMTVTAQYLDSVNVPPPGVLPALWAPVGLRYHALHHLLPGVPYHSLGEAHRRLTAALDAGSCYHNASYRSLPYLVGKIARSTMLPRR